MTSPSKPGHSRANTASSSPKTQATISSYFSQPAGSAKRAVSTTVVDLTLSDAEEEQPVAKKPKLANNSSKKDVESVFLPDRSNPLHDELGPSTRKSVVAPTVMQQSSRTPKKSMSRYEFNDVSGSQDIIQTPEEQRAKKARREAFKRKLLADNNMYDKRPSVVPKSVRRAATVREEVIDIDNLENTRNQEGAESELEVSDNENGVPRLPASITSKAFPSFKGKGRDNSQVVIPSRRSKKDEEEVGPSGQTYTPLEKQIVALKKKYPDALLMVEVGYKYKFFGEDARIASEVLNIAHYPDRNFLTAMVPEHRRDIHLRRLLSHGYKVGIVGQLETAALKKAGDNRNKPFERALTQMYTAATYVDEIDVDDAESRIAPPVFMCISEGMLGGMGVDDRVSVSMVAVTPSTGDVIWDDFEDGFMRNELETRMAHIKPSEILISKDNLSKVTEKILHHHSKEASLSTLARDRVRLERYKDEVNYTDAFQQLQTFYTTQQNKRRASENYRSGKLLAAISDLPRRVVIALAHSLSYLNSFDLGDVLTQTQFFSKFTERQHMLLNANTLSNLEIYRNQTDFTIKGSLMWVLDRTKTSFGARLLRSWIGRPLIDVNALQARVDAVEAINSAEATTARERLLRLRELLKDIGKVDLAKGLSRIQYSKCTPKELAKLIRAFIKVANAFNPFDSLENVGFSNPVLNDIIFALPKARDAVQKIGSSINLKMADDNKVDEIWSDPDKYPEVDDAKMAILQVESELADHLKIIRKVLHKPAAQYMSVNLDEYLVEVKKNEKREIPVTWELVSSTKLARRYRTPEVKKMLQERAQSQERLEAEANKAYLAFLSEIMDEHYVALRNAVNKLAIADCLFSLAEVALQSDYVKPTFVNGDVDVLDIVEGRHPMIELLRDDPFVPNSLCIGGERDTRTKLVTGPNMGGKSSVVRMVALLAIMAQIGSYVPASSVMMSPLDAVLTRMGASDNLARGRSTFMVEMSETSEILHGASKKSLVILDELGRGSSTFDGMAIAGATLEHLAEKINCKTLFITHYPVVASSAERKYPDKVTNLHMGFTENISIEGKRAITFLYRLAKGLSSGSYGIECARLAGISEELLESAAGQADTMQQIVESRGQIARTIKSINILHNLKNYNTDDMRKRLDELRSMVANISLE